MGIQYGSSIARLTIIPFDGEIVEVIVTSPPHSTTVGYFDSRHEKVAICNIAKFDWIKIKEEGIAHTFTIAGWSGKSSLKRLPFVLAYVIVDGCKTAIANEIRGVEPWDPEFGMPVKVVWKPKEERQCIVTDWWFEPADGWKPGPMTPEKESMKKLCQPISTRE